MFTKFEHYDKPANAVKGTLYGCIMTIVDIILLTWIWTPYPAFRSPTYVVQYG